MRSYKLDKANLTERQILFYISQLYHACSDANISDRIQWKGHMIGECPASEKWIKSFLDAYRSGQWKPMLYDANTSLEE